MKTRAHLTASPGFEVLPDISLSWRSRQRSCGVSRELSVSPPIYVSVPSGRPARKNMCGACVGKEKNMKKKIMGMIAVTAALASMTAALPAYAAEGDPVTVQYTDVAMNPDTAFKVEQTVGDGAIIENGSVVLDGWSTKDNKGDDGYRNPRGYIEYTAPADGTVSFTFEASVSRSTQSMFVYVYPGGYNDNVSRKYLEDTLKIGPIVSLAAGETGPTTGSFEVEAGQTYTIFGFQYNCNVAGFYYNFSDFTFTGSFEATEATKYKEPDVTDMVGFYGKAEGTGTSGTVNLYVKNNDDQWSTNSLGTTISGTGDFNFGIIIKGDGVSTYEAAYTVE